MIEWLQQWYSHQCDGDWEHENGIRIETLDNPGWSISIDLIGTELEGLEVPYTVQELSLEIWRGYSVNNNVFKGVGSPGELINLIKIFQELYFSKKPITT